MTRYDLVLDRILKSTPSDHSDFFDLPDIIHDIRKTVDKINACVGLVELGIYTVSNLIVKVGADIGPSGQFMRMVGEQ